MVWPHQLAPYKHCKRRCDEASGLLEMFPGQGFGMKHAIPDAVPQPSLKVCPLDAEPLGEVVKSAVSWVEAPEISDPPLGCSNCWQASACSAPPTLLHQLQ